MDDEELYLDDCMVCEVGIYTSDPHDLYVDKDGDFLGDMVFLAHMDCTPPGQFVKLVSEKPSFDRMN